MFALTTGVVKVTVILQENIPVAGGPLENLTGTAADPDEGPASINVARPVSLCGLVVIVTILIVSPSILNPDRIVLQVLLYSVSVRSERFQGDVTYEFGSGRDSDHSGKYYRKMSNKFHGDSKGQFAAL